jgi:cell division protein FtsW (lipid II flippase)
VRRLLIVLAAALVIAGVLLVAPEALAQAGNDVGENLGDLLRKYAGEIYGGVVAIVALVFLINRRYSELGLFLLAAVVVAWMVFSPDQIARAARGIGDEILP